ncbi:MAG: DNA-directed RNA polymerases I, II, and III subunit RPABC3 [Cirrosporium novae-zelandiae]|nr:MAG: DNA-directed RNA polymerases I, II, and III subunit RPABC3 [Cirrosporium novae-zelandiae]KAI9735551.1 MAG: DNA-directed RNA polymerases I, II, and III subunit RPABC3 [Cirrosporium novae-zelandiae]
MSDAQLYSDTFTIDSINSSKYDRVSRLMCHSLDNTVTLSLDVNTELYPCTSQESFSLVLASTLSLDGTKDAEGEAAKAWRDVGKGTGMGGQATLADMYEYVCYGKIYRFDEGDGETIKVYVSFGGLLLQIQGPYKKLTPLRIDHVYLLMKK